MDDIPCGKITILKVAPEDYLVTVEEYNSGSDTSLGAESVAEGVNEALRWMGLEVSVTVG